MYQQTNAAMRTGTCNCSSLSRWIAVFSLSISDGG